MLRSSLKLWATQGCTSMSMRPEIVRLHLFRREPEADTAHVRTSTLSLARNAHWQCGPGHTWPSFSPPLLLQLACTNRRRRFTNKPGRCLQNSGSLRAKPYVNVEKATISKAPTFKKRLVSATDWIALSTSRSILAAAA